MSRDMRALGFAVQPPSPLIILVLFLLGVFSAARSLDGQERGTPNGEWRYWGADAWSTRYSPLDQINEDNVEDLQIAWRWRADNFGPRPDFNMEATPLMIDGVLYTTAGSRRDVVAIDGATGETLWMFRFEEGLRGEVAPVRAASGRGLAYWSDDRDDNRIVYVTPGYHLIALDAQTGRPIPSFGTDGVVDLFTELDQPVPEPGQIGWNSPPIVVRGVVVIGAAHQALATTLEFPVGHIRGYDVRTGSRLWIFHNHSTRWRVRK